MPKNTFTHRFPHSEHNAVLLDVEVRFVLPFEDDEKQLSVKLKALIDTGATGSCISRRLAAACRLEQISAVQIFSAQGASVSPLYEVDIVLPNGSTFEKVSVMEVAGSNNFDVILGMDILTKCDFAISNVDGEMIFTMRIPSSNKVIDFTTEQD